MAGDTQFILGHLGELEQLAEEILTDKHQIVDLDRTRNGNREALRGLKKSNHPGQAGKTWLCFGNMFIKMPGATAQSLIEQDQERLDTEITRLQKDLAPKVNKLRDIEGQREVKGFDLKALSKEEVKVIHR